MGKGHYALITGASSGIGYELAVLFAQNQHNVVLIARREDKLKLLSEHLENQYNINAVAITSDLSKSHAAQGIYDNLKQKNITVDCLINNAGFIVYGQFSDTDWNEESKMLKLHIQTVTEFIKLFLPDMIQKKDGKILNISSTGSFVPGPYNSVYCATKSYILSLSEALAAEVKGTGVSVTAICPGGTNTEFSGSDNRHLSSSTFFSIMEARKVARIGYKAMMKGKTVVIPGIINQIQVLATRFMPRKMVLMLVKNMMLKYK